jgi:hypothetical protein
MSYIDNIIVIITFGEIPRRSWLNSIVGKYEIQIIHLLNDYSIRPKLIFKVLHGEIEK